MTLAETPLFYALGWTLFHFLWQGSLIALALAAGLYIFRPSSARLRYGLACAAMLSMLVSFSLTLSLSWPRSGVIDSNRGAKPLQPGLVPAPALLPEAVSVAVDEDSRLQRLVPFWILGVALFALRSTVSWFAAQRLRRVGACVAPEYWQRKVTQLAERIHVSRPVVLLESCLAEVPAVIGFFRPVILAPIGLLTGFPPEQVKILLIHELAHIRRYDYLVNLLQSLVEDLLFYHPAVWWVSGLVRAERENCCDDVVVIAGGDAKGLATALNALEHYRWTAREAALAANGGELMNRIRRLLEGNQAPRATASPVFFAGLLVATIALATTPLSLPTKTPLPAAQQLKQVPAPVPARPSANAPKLLAQAETRQPNPFVQELQIPQPYRNWLNEDVVYIISDEERKIFRSFKTDEERQKFIEQFWLRRDPTPGTPQNEFMEEHYRRMAFADAHFSSNGMSGWKTDRGRIYINFGPPDEIDSHLAGGTYQRAVEEGGGITTTFPFEKWRYAFIEGIGTNVNIEFVDSKLTGEFHMTMDPKEKER
jgi:GWxTD domain-containing protein